MYITLANDQLNAQIFNFKLAKVILRCTVSETSKQNIHKNELFLHSSVSLETF